MPTRRFAVEVFFDSFRGPSLNGARMPSIAEDVATDRSTLRSRLAASRRKGLDDDSLGPMVRHSSRIVHCRHREVHGLWMALTLSDAVRLEGILKLSREVDARRSIRGHHDLYPCRPFRIYASRLLPWLAALQSVREFVRYLTNNSSG
jgi:hypothetical protein